MKFQQRSALLQIRPVFDCIVYLDVLFLLVFYYLLATAFTLAPKIDVRIPQTVLSGMLDEEPLEIVITAENVIYWQNTIVSLKDLKTRLVSQPRKLTAILIKADRRASLGRIVEVWDLCKMVGLQRINIATTRE